MDLDALRESTAPVSTGLERILPHGAPAVQAIFDYSGLSEGGVELVFEDARPTLVKRKPLSGIRNNAPSQRVGIYENLVHGNRGTVYSTPRFRRTLRMFGGILGWNDCGHDALKPKTIRR